MKRLLSTDWPSGEWHVPEDALLPFVDGELSDKEATKIRNHLEDCWSCRRRIEKIQATISAFVEYYNKACVVGWDPAPGEWRTFDSKLKAMMTKNDQQSAFRGWLLSRLTPFLGLRSMGRLAVGVLAGALLMLIPYVFYRTPRVSASELIQRASEARNLQISAVAHPVTYQKLRVQAGSQPDKSLTWEIWNNEESGETNQRVEDSAGMRFISPQRDGGVSQARLARESQTRPAHATRHSQAARGSADQSLPPLLRELHQVFRANHMDCWRPLAVASYASWTKYLGRVSEEVRETRLPSGEQAYVLIAAPAGPFETHDISKTELTIRSRDWHPLKQRLEFQEGNNVESLDLTELAFSVSSADSLTSRIVVDNRPFLAPPASSTPAPTEIEWLEAETQARYALHQMGACTGEPVEVRREPSGRVVVQGLVETPERKEKLEEILRHIPLVTVNIQSARNLGPPGVAPGGASLDGKQTEAPLYPVAGANQQAPAGKSPIEDLLREYFTHLSGPDPGHSRMGGRPRAIDEEVTSLSNEAVSLSEAALMEAWALRRLAEAYPRTKTDRLSPRGRRLLEIMLTEHLAALKLHTDQSRALLEPLVSSVGSQAPPPPRGGEDKSTRLFKTNDSTWGDAVLGLWGTTQHMEKLTGYLFTGAQWPEAKQASVQDLLDDLSQIDVEYRHAQARVADRPSGPSEVTGNRESEAARVPP
jgi:anti-sigma factor RsiW